MPGEVESDRAPALGKRGLGEHPGVEVAAEAVDQHDREVVAYAEFQVAQPPPRGVDISRLARLSFRAALDRGFDGGELGNVRVDLGLGHGLGRGYCKQGADRQGGPGLRHDPPQNAAVRDFEDIGDLGRLDLQEFLARREMLSFPLEPADDLALGHRQPPFGHRDRGDRGVHSREATREAQSNRLETERSSLIRRIASAISGAIDTWRMLFACRTASVATMLSVVTSISIGESMTWATAPPDSTSCET